MYRKIIHKRYKNRRYFLLFAILIAVIVATAFLTRIDYSYFIRSKSFDKIIANTAKRHDIDPCFIKAVIYRESKFNQNARGSKGEIGLMQIRKNFSAEDWSREFNMEIPSEGILFSPEMNIEIGTWYLARAVRRWNGYDNRFEMALAEYNAGYSGMKKWIPPNPEQNIVDFITFESTKEYVKNIMKKYREYSQEGRQDL